MEQNLVELDSFVAYTIGIIVYFVGLRMTGRIEFLRSYNIPEPVTGGILASLVALLIFVVFDIEVKYDLHIRDVLLVYFFTTIGINARISDLVAGGKPLLILLLLTLVYIVLQDVVGVATAVAIGQPAAVGVITGSASLIGGHGTSIAWAPEIAANHGVPNALEMGVASATLGLVIASLLGGPIAKYLLKKHDLSGDSSEDNVVGIPHENENTETINHTSIMRVILVIHIAVIIGYGLNEVINEIGIKLPLFVSCLLVAIFMSNLVPLILPKLIWPSRSKALALVSDFSLGLFIAMSLMGMQLWAIADLAGPLLLLLTLQAVVAVVFTVFILFRLMGGDYQAAVLSAGFAGFSLGATPTAIANMTAVTKTHGPAPTAFIILPLVGAFFVDIANSFIIQFFLGL
jgi:ESS family glutamate:Na+ symporter